LRAIDEYPPIDFFTSDRSDNTILHFDLTSRRTLENFLDHDLTTAATEVSFLSVFKECDKTGLKKMKIIFLPRDRRKGHSPVGVNINQNGDVTLGSPH
jgi:hypothetical protein